jgi:LPXTG-site transpeptidase (sortase) family protein
MKILLKRYVFGIGSVGIALFFIFLITYFFLGLPGRSQNATIKKSAQQFGTGLPIRLKIPNINVDAEFEYVGLNSQGAVDVPKNPDNAAWYDLGPPPGQTGSAVVAGHYGWKKGSVFDSLYKLRKGDKIYVEDDKKTITSFVVVDSHRYEPNAYASRVFTSDDGKAHLNLITCDGVWDEVSKSYSKRLVVFTEKEIGVSGI